MVFPWLLIAKATSTRQVLQKKVTSASQLSSLIWTYMGWTNNVDIIPSAYFPYLVRKDKLMVSACPSVSLPTVSLNQLTFLLFNSPPLIIPLYQPCKFLRCELH